ncbi:isochorismatase hydrolase [Trichoderma arundinaceum]|uniref:Isochorismatase hydrolase n=1 Tax=Trichoderma arundinaceum TaxID=490622 RepID=A0A395NZX0_TRIAR|nr:isochorismatase hydrolase [Trichoderma arundinaceum]
MDSPFHIPVSLPHTALLLSDVQTQILARFPEDIQASYLAQIQRLLRFFRAEIAIRRAVGKPCDSISPYDDVPMIIHHTLPFNINSNAFISPYNKLAKWLAKLEAAGHFTNTPSDPNHPDFAVPESLVPPSGWGSKDEILLGKLQPSCFGSSDLLAYLRARGIHHIILVGLTTMGSILGSARAAADLDFHVSLVEQGIMDDDPEVHEFLMTKVLPKFVDIVDVEDILGLSNSHRE